MMIHRMGFNRTLRGGGWNFIIRDCRSATRDGLGPTYRNWYTGFRVALSAVVQADAADREVEPPKSTSDSPDTRGQSGRKWGQVDLSPFISLTKWWPGLPARVFSPKGAGQESNQDLDLRRVQCDPLHYRDRRKGRRLGSHQHHSAYKADAFLSRATSAKAPVQGVEPCRAVLEAACSPRSTPVKAPRARHPWEPNSLIQFHVPVRFADEAGPTVDPHVAARVQRPPHRPNRLLPQRHPSLFGSPVGLPLVAADTRQRTVMTTMARLTCRFRLLDKRKFVYRLLHSASRNPQSKIPPCPPPAPSNAVKSSCIT